MPTGEYLPSSRGTSSTRGLAAERIPGTSGRLSAARAASMAARTSPSDMSSGTTIAGSTTASSSGSTGRFKVSAMTGIILSFLDYTDVKNEMVNFVSALRSR